MDYLFPSTIEDAVEARAEAPNGQFIAGGTDLMVIMADQAVPPDSLIDISRIPELRGIKETEEGIEIGPATTLAELATDSRLPLVLVQGLASVGSLQIRNLATVGGNICNASPCGDTLTPLIVLGAVLVLVSPSGRREVAAEEFFTGPKKTILKRGELLAGIKIPRESLSGGSSFRKIGQRNGQIISQVNVAVWVQARADRKVGEIRAAAGSVGPVPIRLVKAAATIKGSGMTSEIIADATRLAAAEISPISDVRATDDYRRSVITPLLTEALKEAWAEALEQNDNLAPD